MKKADAKITDFLKDAPIFMQPWWLEAVAPGRWDYVVSYKNGEIHAIWPFTYKIRFGIRTIQMPEATPYLGPWIKNHSQNKAKQYSEQFFTLNNLLSLLPKNISFSQRLYPEIRNTLPFYWLGYESTILYTYLFEKITTIEQIWPRLKKNIKSDIRKAQRLLKVVFTDDFNIALEIIKKTFQRQGKKLPENDSLNRKLDRACAEHNCRKILVARDSFDRIHGIVYLIFDSQKVYYYRGGSVPELRNSGVSSFLVYKAIEFAIENGLDFDFEGSMKESISKFFAGFGADLTPYYFVRKYENCLVPLAQKILGYVKR